MKQTAGMTGLFQDPDAVLAAAAELRRAGYQKFDFHTPYPLHGLDEAMGVRRTILPWISLGGGIVGLTAAWLLQWWTGAVDYPLVIGGKPLFGIPPSVPIMFELTVLICGIATTVGMFALNGQPRWFSKWDSSDIFRHSTDDGFVVTVDAGDARYDAQQTRTLLESLGAEQVRIVEYEDK